MSHSLLDFCEPRAIGLFSVMSYLLLAPVLIAKGHMQQGLKMLQEARLTLHGNQRRYWHAVSENILGKVYSQITTGPKPAFSVLAKNIGFLVRNVPFAGKKAEEHLQGAIDLSKEIDAKGLIGRAYLDLGLFYKARKKNQQARECIAEAIKIFKEIGADVFLKQAKAEMEGLT